MSTPSTVNASRGVIALSAANALYIASGYAVTVWLARHFGPATFGEYGVATAVITMVNIVVTRGVPIASTRAIAAGHASERDVMRIGWSTMASLMAAVTVIALVGSEVFVRIVDTPTLRLPLRIGAAAAITYGVQAQLLALLNGRRLFGRQALAQGAYAIVRLATIIGGAISWGLSGAIAGFVAAPGIAAVAAFARPRGDTGPRAPTRRSLLMGGAPLVWTAGSIALLMTVDLIAFRRVGSAAATGRYVAAGAIAHVPFFLLQSAGLVLLPGIAAAADRGERRRIAAHAVSDTVILLSLPVALLIAVGNDALTTIFGAGFSEQGVVPLLAIATAAVTLHAAWVAIDAAIGRLRDAVIFGATAVAALAVAVTLGASDGDPHSAALAAAAVTVTLCLLHGARTMQRIGPMLQWRTVPACALSALVAGGAAVAPHTGSSLGPVIILACTAWLACVLGLRLVSVRHQA